MNTPPLRIKRPFFYEAHREPSEPRWGKLPMRLSWALRKPMTGGLAARARCFWHTVMRGYVYEICGDCGGPVGAATGSWWGAPDDLWEEISGGPGGVLCPACFTRRCDAAGIAVHYEAVVGV